MNYSSNKVTTPKRQKSVLYALVKNQDYPRNERIRESLSAEYEIHITPGLSLSQNYLKRSIEALKSGLRVPAPDVVVLSELNLQYFPAIWLLARLRRSFLVVDWFVGMYETNVLDWAECGPRSIKARLYKFYDYISVRCADLVVTDTDVRAERLRLWVGYRTKVMTLPVGSPSWITAKPISSYTTSQTVLFYGDFLPLHGVETILKAAATSYWPENARLTLIGDSDSRASFESLARRLEISDLCDFVGRLNVTDLAKAISGAHIVLGVFGSSEKAMSVIPNKVWQGLSAGRTVITRQSPAYAEIRKYAAGNLIEVQPTAESLALAVKTALENHHPTESGVQAALEAYVQRRFEEFHTALRDI